MRKLLAKLLSGSGAAGKPDRAGADRCAQETRTALREAGRLPCAAPLREAGSALPPGRLRAFTSRSGGVKTGGEEREEGKKKKRKKKKRLPSCGTRLAGRSPPAPSAAMVSERRGAEALRGGRVGVRGAGGRSRRGLTEAGAEGSGGRDGGAAGPALSARGQAVWRP